MKLTTKHLFEADSGRVFVEVDLSQIEVRVLACLSEDTNLIEDMWTPGFDMHCRSAAFYLGCSYEEAVIGYKNGDQQYVAARKLGKTISFEMQYGAAPKSVSNRNGIPLDKVKAFYKAYEDRYTGVMRFHNENEKLVYRNGGILRVKQSPRSWKISKFEDGKYSRNQIMNYPVQGISYDVNELIWIHEFQRDIWKHRQVHDAVTFSVKEGDVDALNEIREVYDSLPTMVSDTLFPCLVPLPYEVKTGKTLAFE